MEPPSSITELTLLALDNHLHQLWEGTIMRATIALACTIVAAQLVSATGPAQAAPAKAKAQAAERWCLRTESGGSDCGYRSLEQCNATRAGNAYSFCWRSRREHKGTPGR
jgi:hypothetical protein